ncbi:MAG: hypothetical protein IPJ49_13570 [Candidatus Obscuribacter sp.]|nr:hypothetical protein [Candidatus Obscuribacter sp.]
MFNRKSAAEASGPRYLEPLTRVPNLGELQKQCETAQVARQRELLQAWYLSTGKDEELPPSYAIGVMMPREPYNAQPVWSFYEVLPKELRTHWSYETADVSLIHNMILCALPEQALAPEVDNSYAFTSTLARGEAESASALSPVQGVSSEPQVIAVEPSTYGAAIDSIKDPDALKVDRSYERDDALALTPPSDQPSVIGTAIKATGAVDSTNLTQSVKEAATASVPADKPAPAAPQSQSVGPFAVSARSELQKEFGYLVAPQKIGALESLLYNPVTGLLSAAAFAHHLSSEFTRRRVCGGSFTLVVMRLRTASGVNVDLDKAAERISLIRSIVRPCDMLYQIDNYGFILILPDIDTQVARQYCSDFLRQIVAKKRANNLDRVFIKVGVATAPAYGLTSAQVFESAMSKENSSITAL